MHHRHLAAAVAAAAALLLLLLLPQGRVAKGQEQQGCSSAKAQLLHMH